MVGRMNDIESGLPPPARLAVAYAPHPFRGAFSLLLRFDARFASVVGKASEPMIGQMKLAWWRDALLRPSGARPKGEPLLSELGEFESQITASMVEQLVSAWEILLAEDQWSPETLNKFAGLRGSAIFETYADMVGVQYDVSSLGAAWAAEDLRMQFGTRVPQLPPRAARPNPRARLLRPLTILAMSVRGVSGPRLIWHALTGR
jgi:15-cis-phytoene synthase